MLYYLYNFSINLNLLNNNFFLKKALESWNKKWVKAKPVWEKLTWFNKFICSLVYLFIHWYLNIYSTNIHLCLLCGNIVLECKDSFTLQWASSLSSDRHMPEKKLYNIYEQSVILGQCRIQVQFK